jgi:hypothetical protein
MGEYQEDREWADQFLTSQMELIAPILGKYMMRVADFVVDTRQAGDLTILRGPQNIGLRVRRPGYAARYGLREFTLRSLRTSRMPTELEKITQGHGGWFAYFHSDEQERLTAFSIIDLDSFRRWPRSGIEYANTDRTTFFRVYRITEFPVGILIGASQNVLTELPPLFGFAVARRQQGLWDPTPEHLRRQRGKPAA